MGNCFTYILFVVAFDGKSKRFFGGLQVIYFSVDHREIRPTSNPPNLNAIERAKNLILKIITQMYYEQVMNKVTHQNTQVSLYGLLAEPGDETSHLQFARRALYDTHVRHSYLLDKF